LKSRDATEPFISSFQIVCHFTMSRVQNLSVKTMPHIHLQQCHINVVAAKCSQNHFISEKYKVVQSFKLHSL